MSCCATPAWVSRRSRKRPLRKFFTRVNSSLGTVSLTMPARLSKTACMAGSITSLRTCVTASTAPASRRRSSCGVRVIGKPALLADVQEHARAGAAAQNGIGTPAGEKIGVVASDAHAPYDDVRLHGAGPVHQRASAVWGRGRRTWTPPARPYAASCRNEPSINAHRFGARRQFSEQHEPGVIGHQPGVLEIHQRLAVDAVERGGGGCAAAVRVGAVNHGIHLLALPGNDACERSSASSCLRFWMRSFSSSSGKEALRAVSASRASSFARVLGEPAAAQHDGIRGRRAGKSARRWRRPLRQFAEPCA